MEIDDGMAPEKSDVGDREFERVMSSIRATISIRVIKTPPNGYDEVADMIHKIGEACS